MMYCGCSRTKSHALSEDCFDYSMFLSAFIVYLHIQ